MAPTTTIKTSGTDQAIQDTGYMQAALALARRGVGKTWPNPSVGCVMVKDARVVGLGATAQGGRPHAETQAITMAGEQARGATAYVTLEPCCHTGKTPPCADALIAAGIVRVVVAATDPDPRVSGGGIARLHEAGLDVSTGLLEPQAQQLNEGFFKARQQHRPFVTVKLATTLDGAIASATGHSQWITSDKSRAHGHLLRSQHDAVLVGIGTALADDPDLTCRLPGMTQHPPVSIVMDGHLTLPPTCQLVKAAKSRPVWVVTQKDCDPGRASLLATLGVTLILVDPGTDQSLDLPQTLSVLAEKGLTKVLVEGGGKIITSLFKAHLVDRLVWFRAPSLMGGDGLSAVLGLGVDQLDSMPKFVLTDSLPVGTDRMDTLHPL